ncbi:TIGR03016 family PEP-CTERM system-associated outer membrane protein [Geminicoccaceae bacterium 1502E]|nr:TIGR03016 family PEP-CTERM system-associated outer membrane protein [Geminicoccaceae bacterium 1502E]
MIDRRSVPPSKGPLLVERAADRLGPDLRLVGTAEPPPVAAVRPVASAAPREEPQPPPAAGAGAPPRAEPAPGRPAPQTLDRARLVADGFVDPAGDRSTLAEELRVIKRPLLARAFAEGVVARDRVLLVTSARPGEGKTFTAINLALSLSLERDANVLLIDADQVMGAASAVLGMPRSPGLSELLGDRPCDPAAILRATDLERFTFTGPGAPDDRFAEMLASRRMAAILDAVLAADPRRVVVIDGPPLLASSDAVPLAMLAGQTVFVVEAGATPRAVVDEALALVVEHSQVQLLLNKSLGSRRAGSYGYYGSGSGGRRLGTAVGVAAWTAMLAPPLALGNWSVVPRLELGMAVTDNVKLAADGRKDADMVFTVAPGVRVAGETARLRANADYAVEQVTFAETRSGDRLRQRLDASSRAELVENHLFLDIAGNVGESFETGREPVPRTGFTDSGNRTTRMIGSASPFVRARLGEAGDAELRYRYTRLDYADGDLAEASSHSVTGLLTSMPRGEQLGWTGTLAADRTDFSPDEDEAGRQTGTRLATVDLRYELAQGWAALAGAGYSWLDDETLEDGGGSSPYLMAGFEARPWRGTTLRATGGTIYGEPRIDVAAETALTASLRVRAGYEQGLETRYGELRQALADAASFRERPRGESEEEAERRRTLEEISRARVDTLDNELVNRVRRGRLSLTLEQDRNLGVLSGYVADHEAERARDDERTFGVELDYVRRLSRRNDLLLGASWEHRDVAFDNSRSDTLGLTAVWRHQLGRSTRLELGYDIYHRLAGESGDVTANTVFARAVREF